MELRAVISGDIVNSSAIKEKKLLTKALKEIFEQIDFHTATDCHYDIYRGDSFQIYIPDPYEVWRIAILIRAGLKENEANEKQLVQSIRKGKTVEKETYPIQSLWDARISIGIGMIEYISENISESHGEAFELSGNGLNMLEKSGDRLVLNSKFQDLNKRFNLISYMIDTEIKGWTRNSAQIIFKNLLRKKTQAALAEELGITQSAVNQRLNIAQWTGISSSVEHFKFELSKAIENDRIN